MQALRRPPMRWFYRFWHDVIPPAPLRAAHAVYDRLTRNGTHGTTPDAIEYYDLFAIDPLPRWQDGQAPFIRRLHASDAPAIEMHLLRLDAADRQRRFFRESADLQIRAYVRDINWSRSLMLGAVQADRVVAMAEALFDRSESPRHAEIAVTVDRHLRRRGLGSQLVAQAVERAGALGIRRTNLSFLRENRPIRHIIRTLSGQVDMEDLVGAIPTVELTHVPAGFDQRLAA